MPHDPNKKSKVASVVKYLALLALAGVLLYFSFRGVKWSDFIEGLKNCNWVWIVVSMAVGVLGFLARALRWRLLMLPLNKEITNREAFDGVNVAYLTNFAFPRAGEVARCGVMAKTGKISFEGALGTVVLERVVDLLTLIIWVLVVLLVRWQEFGSFMKENLFEPLMGKFSSAIVPIAIIVAVLALGGFLLWYYRESIIKNRIFAKIYGIISGLKDGLLTAFKMERKGLFFLYTLLLWGTYWLTSMCTILAFPQVSSLNAVDALFLMVIGGLGWVVPVQGGLGAYHYIVSLTLAAVYSIPQVTGVIFATISHEAQALTMIVCGLLSFISISAWNKKRN
ncbi:MAG: flippase-like domain-containing protein [Bacteroidales bacterium]|nr:flippase-like domain-containing protein [Bacteroidales bacterium]